MNITGETVCGSNVVKNSEDLIIDGTGFLGRYMVTAVQSR
jgi:hypothetical protein